MKKHRHYIFIMAQKCTTAVATCAWDDVSVAPAAAGGTLMTENNKKQTHSGFLLLFSKTKCREETWFPVQGIIIAFIQLLKYPLFFLMLKKWYAVVVFTCI